MVNITAGVLASLPFLAHGELSSPALKACETGIQHLDRNASETWKSCQQAAEQGHPMAQYIFGVMYSKGDGVKQDDGEAVKWFRKAAE